MEINSFIQKAKDEIEQKLDELIPEKQVPHKSLYTAARYSALGIGKRLRPILVLATTKMLKGDKEAALVPACALEMVHTYSLIHDDLPAMDNDDYRRGKPTLHKVYPESHAILTGDFLLTYAFDVLSHAPHLTSEQKISLIQILASCSGGDGMIGGQLMDLEGKHESLDHIYLMHHCKTAKLIQAAVCFGGIIAKATEKEMDALTAFAKDIGLAFQIVDDILDVTASVEKHGSQIGSDQANDKTTCVTLLGIDKAKTYAQQLHKNALAQLDTISYDSSLLAQLATLIIERQK